LTPVPGCTAPGTVGFVGRADDLAKLRRWLLDVRLWELLSGRMLATLQSHPNAVSGVALSADGHLSAMASPQSLRPTAA
jgi:hypothetical protein